jgi:23S rRNA (adenine2503-C2)-methyltransferase
VDQSYRSDQIFEALHAHGVTELVAITTLSKPLRSALGDHFRVGGPGPFERRAAADGTVKYLFTLLDGASIEAVDIPDGDRHTLCLSSQAGCALGCTFCVTGYWGAGRNLTPDEIVGQWLAIRRTWIEAPRRVNLVFMGMGEPLLNLEHLEEALAVLAEAISLRRITVSTAGVVPGIEALARWPRRPNLAVSLHAPDDRRRSELMPINRSYPLADLRRALRTFPLEPGRRLTFEYLLIRGFNDHLRDADDLARWMSGLPAKVNLIPVNPDPVLKEEMVPPPPETVSAFRDRLRQRGVVATVRQRRGDQVQAACGQLRAFARTPSGVLARRAGRSPVTPAR